MADAMHADRVIYMYYLGSMSTSVLYVNTVNTYAT